jgi:alanyl-tRNA synthetase
VQDGVTRFRYKAGSAALKFIQKEEALIRDTCIELKVPKTDLVKAINKLFNDWKERGKQLEKLSEKYSEELVKNAEKGETGRLLEIKVTVPPETAQKIAKNFVSKGFDVVVVTDTGFVVAMTTGSSKRDAIELLKKTGAKGGGTKNFARGKKS